VAKEPAKSVATEPAAGVTKAPKAAGITFQDDPAAHGLYNQMIEAMRKANSLSYACRHAVRGEDNTLYSDVYRVWLKKPNYFRVEGEVDKGGGILIGDGKNLWVYWPKGRPAAPTEDKDVYEKTRLNSFMTKPAPLGGHSIAHETGPIGVAKPIIDPSTFFGYMDLSQRYLDGVKSLGSEQVGSEDCDKIEVSIMKHQRSWYVWLSKSDHLPRKLKQIVRVSYDFVMEEQWFELAVNADIPDTMFAWKPPEGWKPWKFPDSKKELLKPGTQGSDFQLALTDGKRIKLSDFRGQVVWFYIWRAG
jgi:outer membrane lipoprotein-sorting protein